MNCFQRGMAVILVGATLVGLAAECFAVDLEFAGSHLNVGGTFFSNGGTPPCCIVPWRSDSEGNIFATSNEGPNRYYGTAGYAVFATRFDYPDQNVGYYNTVSDPIFADNDFFIDKVELPSFVTASQILSTHKAGGWAYALIDDPVMQHGYREWTFDGANYPPATGPCPGPNCNVTGGVPYVKLGILTGGDVFGNDPATSAVARWGFTVGEDAPANFRVGVMTDGLDSDIFAAGEVQLTHAVNNVPVSTVTSGVLVRNRFVDMHFFDISGAQAGDQFVFSGKRAAGDPGFANPGIAGFTFDLLASAGTPGDYNSDGEVNAADYTVWRDHLDQTFQLPNEGAGQTPGLVTSEDYDFWKSQFGAGGGGALATGVPEPSSLALLLFSFVVGIGRLRDR